MASMRWWQPRRQALAKGTVYKVLANRIYLGEAVRKGVACHGEHAAIIDRHAWDKAMPYWPSRRTDAAPRPGPRYLLC